MANTPSKQIDLYGNQYHFVHDPHHYAALIGGIGSGKSLGGAARALSAALGYVGNERIPTPNMGMITAPTYPMLRDASLRTFFEVAGDWILPGPDGYNKSEGLIRLVNGSEIVARSADNPDRLRGPNLSWWWGDEAGMYRPDVWKVGIGRLRQFGMFGYAWVTTTPKGRNWLWQRFVNARDQLYKIFRLKTRNNPFLDREFVAALVADYSGDFARQELDGEFIAFEGLIYPEFDYDTHVIVTPPRAFSRVVAGVDFGYTHASVIQVVGVDYDGRKYLIHEDYQRRRLDADLAAAGRQIRDAYNVDVFYCDPSNPDGIKEFKKLGLRTEEANNAVLTGIQAVKHLFQSKRLHVATSAAWTISELGQYQWMENRDGLRDQPRKTNDHAMDALRYAVMALEEPKRQPRQATAKQVI